jgi:predicted ATPase
VSINSTDYRKQYDNDSNSNIIDIFFHTSKNRVSARDAFLSSFNSNTVHPSPTTLRITPTRNINIPLGFPSRAALLSFASLCGSAHGPAEFSKLCDVFPRGIYLSGPVKAFTKREIDAVKRFVTLIDIAYEKRVLVFLESEMGIDDMFEDLLVNDDGSTSAHVETKIIGQGGSSSSHATTTIGNMEWSGMY